MASIEVDTAALHAAARSIDNIAEMFASAPSPSVAVSGTQATAAAVKAVHAAAGAAESGMAARLRSTAAAMAAGGTSFAMTERMSTEALAALAPVEE